MVSSRCKMMVRQELKKQGLHFIFTELGEIEVMENISGERIDFLKKELRKSGLVLLDELNSILIEGIKNSVIELIYKTSDILQINYHQYLSDKFKHDYSYLSNQFLTAQGVKIDQYILAHKIERVKEMIIYDTLNILEITQKLNFNDIGELYFQFKKATGLSPFDFKQLKIKRQNVIKGDVNS